MRLKGFLVLYALLLGVSAVVFEQGCENFTLGQDSDVRVTFGITNLGDTSARNMMVCMDCMISGDLVPSASSTYYSYDPFSGDPMFSVGYIDDFDYTVRRFNGLKKGAHQVCYKLNIGSDIPEAKKWVVDYQIEALDPGSTEPHTEYMKFGTCIGKNFSAPMGYSVHFDSIELPTFPQTAVFSVGGREYHVSIGETATMQGCEENLCEFNVTYLKHNGGICAEILVEGPSLGIDGSVQPEPTPEPQEEQQPESELTPEPESGTLQESVDAQNMYSGQHHICREIVLSEKSQVNFEFEFESYNDTQRRVFMYGYDCPDVNYTPQMISSGCWSEICSGGSICYMGSGTGAFDKDVSLVLEAGRHEVCAWPSEPGVYFWTARMTHQISDYQETPQVNRFLEQISSVSVTNASGGKMDISIHYEGDEPLRITGLLVKLPGEEQEACKEEIASENPWYMPRSGYFHMLCDILYQDTGMTLQFSAEGEAREFQIAPSGVKTHVESCEGQGTANCADVDGCYWSEACGCLEKGVECGLEEEQMQNESSDCPTGCTCSEDGNIECDDVKKEPTIICSSGCLLNEKCISMGLRATLDGVESYCDIDTEWKLQKGTGEPCQNDYECRTNACTSGTCYDVVEDTQKTQSLLESILNFLRRLFGLET